MGAPAKYDPVKMLPLVERVCALGATDNEVAEILEIGRNTLYRWKHQHPDFAKAMTVGKDEADSRVEQTLYRRAVGYDQLREKVVVANGEPMNVTYTEHVDPDIGAICFWLKNRLRDKWRTQQPVTFELPENSTPVEKLESVFNAVAQGKFAPQDAASLIQSVKAMMEVEEMTILKAKLEQLEAQLSGTSAR